MCVKCAGPAPCPQSVKIMKAVDALKPGIRRLVHEFGLEPVTDLVLEGYHEVEALREQLVAWRAKKQAEWLAEIPYRRKSSLPAI